MKQLGISIYPGKSTETEDKAYIERASKYGFTRIFTNLLQLTEDNKESILPSIESIIKHAKKYRYEIFIDVAPRTFKLLNIEHHDLSFFHKLGIDGIRLDEGVGAKETSDMTYNQYGIKIELNMSVMNHYLDNVIDFEPNRDQLVGCHNFYPHRYAGISEDFFIEGSKKYKKYGLRTAAFVSSEKAEFGPWPITEGLPTLEQHRGMPVTTQAKYLWSTGLIDDVIISNCYPSDEELESLNRLKNESLTFDINLDENITDLERKIVLEEPHFYRGDVSDYIVRSTQSRVKYKDESFPPHDTVAIKRGDVLIDNEEYGQYKGELQIALKPMINTGKVNVVGKIVHHDVQLLDYLKPWEIFKFNKKGK
ncbi:DUF871 domain-containing protein [Mammaliicoccus stepanovicii]|uniref:Cellobiose operon outer surface protein n=1 Tax=Mammaliicoccus stepanovicii TaxID=643214 RepID=A0A239YI88_9STAP|nr:MupG family TIM beta-alpha barrel fold protein [Mammaliicoccus stepanovicii]PNZ74708.1 DUF871 domain-containing protein [Mammaliicoccus stepanovicii]GGI40807.1 hypothetical protein GCM10010896_10210 [Mammaliicoccus stepanovicii]SNV58133.1 cellobiose operon outer surface protein [Mammaliicoccus stepanovicii]